MLPPDFLSYQWNEQTNAFASGLAATIFDWPGAQTVFTDPEQSEVAEHVAVAPLPAHRTATSTVTAHGLAVNACSNAKGEAAEFLAHCTADEELVSRFEDFSFYPPSRAVAENVIESAPPEQEPWLTALGEAINTGREWITHPRWSEVAIELESMVGAALSGQKSIDQALADTAAQARTILGQG